MQNAELRHWPVTPMFSRDTKGSASCGTGFQPVMVAKNALPFVSRLNMPKRLPTLPTHPTRGGIIPATCGRALRAVESVGGNARGPRLGIATRASHALQARRDECGG